MSKPKVYGESMEFRSMIRDLIVEEVRQIRRKTEEACGHDWKRLVEHYRQVPVKSGQVIRREPKQLPRTAAS